LRLWAAVGEVYPQAQQQLCWNHKNVLDAVSHHLTTMMYAESGGQAQRKKFEQRFRHNPKAVKTVVAR